MGRKITGRERSLLELLENQALPQFVLNGPRYHYGMKIIERLYVNGLLQYRRVFEPFTYNEFTITERGKLCLEKLRKDDNVRETQAGSGSCGASGTPVGGSPTPAE